VSPSGRIGVSGVGVLGAGGVGRQALESLLREGRPATTEVDRSEGLHAPSSATRACLVGRVDLRDWIPPLVARRMSPPSRYAVVAAKAALIDARLEPETEPDVSTAVVMSTAFGATSYTQRLLDQILDEGPQAASPALFTECVANAPAAQIAIQTRAAGANHTLCGREAGDLLAVGRAATEIVCGRARRVMAGAVDEMVPVLHATLDRFGALARGRDDRQEVARPFDRDRNGFLAAEGAAVLVLESDEELERRHAEPSVWVRAWHRAFDPTASRAGWGQGVDRLAYALRQCLDRHGLSTADIDAVVSGASGSVAGDRLEARVLRRVWADADLPPVIAPKAIVGEYGGGLLATAVLIAAGSSPGPTHGFVSADPELDLVPYDGSGLPPPRRVLVSALAAGGTAAWLILERA
jgi:3-oxoacyl-[acyl-carrier-protein] synthase II